MNRIQSFAAASALAITGLLPQAAQAQRPDNSLFDPTQCAGAPPYRDPWCPLFNDAVKKGRQVLYAPRTDFDVARRQVDYFPADGFLFTLFTQDHVIFIQNPRPGEPKSIPVRNTPEKFSDDMCAVVNVTYDPEGVNTLEKIYPAAAFTGRFYTDSELVPRASLENNPRYYATLQDFSEREMEFLAGPSKNPVPREFLVSCTPDTRSAFNEFVKVAQRVVDSVSYERRLLFLAVDDAVQAELTKRGSTPTPRR